MEVVIYRTVASAIAGDTKAIAMIADQVEGRAGLRLDYVAPDDPACRQRVQAAIETLVRFMAERAADAPTMGPDDALGDNPR